MSTANSKPGTLLAHVALFALTLTLGACFGQNTVRVNDSVVSQQGRHYSQVDYVEDAHAVTLPDDLRKALLVAFASNTEEFHKGVQRTKAGGNSVPRMIVHWKAVTYEPGNIALREYFGGLGAGESTLDVEARFLDPDSTQIAKIRLHSALRADIDLMMSDNTYHSQGITNAVWDYFEKNFYQAWKN